MSGLKKQLIIREGFTIDSQKILEIAVKAASSKHAEEIVALDVRNVSTLADYFVICHGNSEKQVGAITNEIIDKEEENKVVVKRVEGKESNRWVLVDLGDVVVHIFHGSERDFYNLDKLWSDVPLVSLTDILEDEYAV